MRSIHYKINPGGHLKSYFTSGPMWKISYNLVDDGPKRLTIFNTSWGLVNPWTRLIFYIELSENVKHPGLNQTIPNSRCVLSESSSNIGWMNIFEKRTECKWATLLVDIIFWQILTKVSMSWLYSYVFHSVLHIILNLKAEHFNWISLNIFNINLLLSSIMNITSQPADSE